MEESAALEINATFDYKGDSSNKLVSFFSDHIQIDAKEINSRKNEISSQNSIEKIKYTEVRRITYNDKSMKIVTNEGLKIEIPCCSTDIKKIRTIFRSRDDSSIKKMDGSALVRLADCLFTVLIKSNDIRELKTSIIRRIAEHFYPTYEPSAISMGMFNKLSICLQTDTDEVQLSNCEDLEAALNYFDGKLRLAIREITD